MSTGAVARPPSEYQLLKIEAGDSQVTVPGPQASFQGIIGRSEPMLAMYSRIDRVSRHYRTALILGGTGVGKELAARAMHDLSPARTGHFVIINCSAVVETLFESELFGHVRGAFTGADRDKMGLFEFAHGGTLFLDEVGDMPLSTQAKLLRTLQTREVQRVGSLTGRKVDVRVVAATNKNLRQAVRDKSFREDLYYRLSMVEIEMPPLCERDGDLPLLIDHFTRQWSNRFGKVVQGFERSALEALATHNWPGNVRELENAVGHACMMASGPTMSCADLPYHLSAKRGVGSGVDPAATQGRIELPASMSPRASDILEECELRLICQVLEEARWNQSLAARILRTTRDRLRYKMKKYGLVESGPHQAAGVLELAG